MKNWVSGPCTPPDKLNAPLQQLHVSLSLSPPSGLPPNVCASVGEGEGRRYVFVPWSMEHSVNLRSHTFEVCRNTDWSLCVYVCDCVLVCLIALCPYICWRCRKEKKSLALTSSPRTSPITRINSSRYPTYRILSFSYNLLPQFIRGIESLLWKYLIRPLFFLLSVGVDSSYLLDSLGVD